MTIFYFPDYQLDTSFMANWLNCNTSMKYLCIWFILVCFLLLFSVPLLIVYLMLFHWIFHLLLWFHPHSLNSWGTIERMCSFIMGWTQAMFTVCYMHYWCHVCSQLKHCFELSLCDQSMRSCGIMYSGNRTQCYKNGGVLLVYLLKSSV